MGKKRIPLEKRKYGRLEVLKEVREGKLTYYICRCDCGNTTKTRKDLLVQGQSQSCGCLRKEILRAAKQAKKKKECTNCGKSEHYAKGLCKNCYEKQRRVNKELKEQIDELRKEYNY